MDKTNLEEEINEALDEIIKHGVAPDDIISLADTVPLMLSDDYRKRRIAELLQVSIRYAKLKKYINKCFNEGKSWSCITELHTQLIHMKNYATVLKNRVDRMDTSTDEVNEQI